MCSFSYSKYNERKREKKRVKTVADREKTSRNLETSSEGANNDASHEELLLTQFQNVEVTIPRNALDYLQL
jgi:hypothetical protein